MPVEVLCDHLCRVRVCDVFWTLLDGKFLTTKEDPLRTMNVLVSLPMREIRGRLLVCEMLPVMANGVLMHVIFLVLSSP